MNVNGNLRVAVLYEEPIIAAGLMTMLGAAPGVSVVPSPDPSFFNVDVLVSDYKTLVMLVQNGASKHPPVMVVARGFREVEVLQTITLGARGYILISCTANDLMNALQIVSQGGRHFCPEAAECIVESVTRQTLTPREGQVLRLVSCGLCNKTIAKYLGISISTVKCHVKSVLEKLGASSRTQAAAIATFRGLLDHRIAPSFITPCNDTESTITRANLTADHPIALQRMHSACTQSSVLPDHSLR
ncbi:response regulator transcription factor [Aquincola sp. J276]|uniref:response regulator transcription factor n=1 Tax=Aquincola sp. J276 TaxID=2898432 RepID=UPI0021512389|nr:response regulator transcription factor [Aquincola sp. J276]MCR5868185.1 response regulator transcription factor [Aquincola sp. J276]